MSRFLEVAAELLAKPMTVEELISVAETLPCPEDAAMFSEAIRKTFDTMAAGPWVDIESLSRPTTEYVLCERSDGTKFLAFGGRAFETIVNPPPWVRWRVTRWAEIREAKP